MARNSLYPGFIKLQYTAESHVHYATLPVKPYLGAGGVYWLETRLTPVGDGVWTTKLDDFVALFKTFLHTSATISNAELWTMASPTADPIFVAGYALSVAGTLSATQQPNSQSVMTMRSASGGIARVYIMEGAKVPNLERFSPSYGGDAQFTALHNYLVSNLGVIVARDGGFPIAGIRALTKTNDALRKKFLLS